MKKILALMLAALLCLTVFAGCNQTSGSDGWKYIADKGELVVGLDDTFAPMGFRDEAGELVGFDIDLANAVGEKLDVTITFQPIDWKAKEMELSSKRIDCIWNGMSATAERQESMALTKKYLNNRIVVMVLDPSIHIASVEDLVNLQIGTQEDSSALEAMQTNEAFDSFSANITEYPTYDECILDIQAGRLDCIVVDEVLGEYKNTKLEEKFTVCAFDFGDDFYAIGCRKEDPDVAEKLNAAIQELIDDGTAAAISEKWFGHNIVLLEDYE